VLFSFFLPLLTIEVAVDAESQFASMIPADAPQSASFPQTAAIPSATGNAPVEKVSAIANTSPAEVGVVVIEKSLDWISILLGIYLIGVVFSLGKLVKGLYHIKTFKSSGAMEDYGHYKLIICKTDQPFSFFNLIFISQDHLNSADFDIILKHESIHCDKRHSLDAVFFELLKTMLWFNPAVYLLSRLSKLNNEFCTDESVVSRKGLQVYSDALLSLGRLQNSSKSELALVNSFAVLSLKPRVMQLVKKPSKNSLRITYTAFIPLVTLFFMLFSCNLTEEVGKSGRLKSVKGYFHDEYGDQSHREGSLVVDMKFAIDGTVTGGSPASKFIEGTDIAYNDLRLQLPFMRWEEEVDIIKFGKKWPELSKEIDNQKTNNLITKIGEEDANPNLRVRSENIDGAIITIVVYNDDDDEVIERIVGKSLSFDFDEEGRVLRSYRTYYTDRRTMQRMLKSTTKKVDELNRSGDLAAARRVRKDFDEFYKNGRYHKSMTGEYQYDLQGRLVGSVYPNSTSYSKREFTYDEQSRLIHIREFDATGLSNCSFEISYSATDEIEEVIAYSKQDELEYKVKYEYQYY